MGVGGCEHVNRNVLGMAVPEANLMNVHVRLSVYGPLN